jgi:hypothetical protein
MDRLLSDTLSNRHYLRSLYIKENKHSGKVGVHPIYDLNIGVIK